MPLIANCCRSAIQPHTAVQYKPHTGYDTKSAVKAPYTAVRYPIELQHFVLETQIY